MSKSIYPQYGVSWITHRVCEGCGHVHKEKHTWLFHTPAAAMDQAVFIRTTPGYSLLSVDQ
jgi:hypothetical protein